MKKLTLLILLAAFALTAHAQTDDARKEYFANLDKVMEISDIDPAAGLDLCNRIQERYGLAADLRYCRGACYVYLGDLNAAFNEFTLAISSWRKDDYFRIGAYYRALASIAEDGGDYPAAIRYLSKGISKDKKYYTLYHLRGNCYQSLAQYKKAIADFRKASLDPDHFCDAKADMALCYANLGDLKSARRELELSLHEDTYHAESRRVRSLISLTEGNNNDFIDDYLIYMQVSRPTEPSFIFDLCENRKSYEYARNFATEILESQSDSLGMAYWEWVLGSIEINGGNEPEMWRHAQRARQLNPGITKLDTKIWFQYATHYSYTDDNDNLLITLDTLIARDDRDEIGNYALRTAKAHLLTQMKRYADAAASFEDALRIGVFDADDRNIVFYSLADLYHDKLNNPDRAIQYYDSVLSLNPASTATMYQVGKIYLHSKNDTAKAYEVFNTIILTEKDMPMSNLLCSQFALAAMGRFADAEAFQQRLDDYARTADHKRGMAYNAACLYSIIGKKDLAVQHLMDAMDAGELSCQTMKNDRDFDNIRNTDEYKAIEKMICLAEEE